MRPIITIILFSWLLLLGGLAGWSVAHGQALPAPSCTDILTVEAETAMETGWQQDSKVPVPSGGMAYLWTKGEAARLLFFAPEGVFEAPKGSVLLRLGRCEDHGQAFDMYVALLDGEHM